ncbi:MAG: 6,7-dimethyl-8-ribityllumazine synthase [Candidatus Moraniibacteriota bacterium]
MQRNNQKKTAAVDAKKFKIAIVVAKFNEDITGGMLKGALETLEKNGAHEKNVELVWVPGALEIPLACQRLAKTKKYQGIVALGCVIKGDTDHYYYVCEQSISRLMQVSLENNLPIGMGIITTDNLKQAKDRAGTKNNKGTEATQAMLEMI